MPPESQPSGLQSTAAESVTPQPATEKPKPAYETIPLREWKQFMQFAELYSSTFDTHIWRGQADSRWPLESTLYREAKSIAMEPDMTKAHLTGFKRSALGRVQDLQYADSDNRWWAAGRHAGLAAPLLDWTMSPYVAAFFAFWKTDSRAVTNECAVFCLDWFATMNAGKSPGRQAASAADAEAYKNCLALILPQARDNPPMARQSGMFTRLYPPCTSIEEWVRGNWEGRAGTLLTKYIIPASESSVALASLRRMNIHPASLFPDVRGSAEFSNIWLKNESYPPWVEKLMDQEQFTLGPPESTDAPPPVPYDGRP